jgi:hypothetical protein
MRKPHFYRILLLLAALSIPIVVMARGGTSLSIGKGSEVVATPEQVRYWAPGVINREQGTVELELSILRTPAGMKTDWYLPMRVVGNSPDAGNSILGIAFCPANDPRDFAGIYQDSARKKNIATSSPEYELGKPYRIALRWGNGASSLWFDGRKLASGRFSGKLSTLPEFFTIGDSRAFTIHGVRISDYVRPDVQLSDTTAPLQADEHTTFGYSSEKGLIHGNTDWQVKNYIAGVFPDRRAAALVARVGAAVEIPVRVVNYFDTDADFEIQALVRNRVGSEVASKHYKMTVTANADYQLRTIQLPALEETGYFETEFLVKGPDDRSVSYLSSFVVWPEQTAATGALANYLGHHHELENKPDLFTQIGIHWNRTWGSGLNRFFLWCHVEPAPGHFEWALADEALAESEEQGIQTLGLLAGPPAWASTYSLKEREKFLPVIEKYSRGTDWSRRPDRYQPRNLEEWRNYVRAVVGRYHERVKFWEVYNEVDFHPPNRLASFSGTTQDYVNLLQIVSEEVHAIDPEATVMSSGFSMVSDSATDLSMPREMLRLGGADYIDAFAFHGYARRELIESATQAARKYQPGVPLWQTERQYMMGQTPRDDYQTVRQAFWGLSQGWDKFFLHGTDTDKTYGNLKLTRHFAVTAELARQLSAADRMVGSVPGLDGHMEGWKLLRADGKYLQYFASGPMSAQLQIAGLEPDDLVQVTNLYGETLYDGRIGSDLLLELPDDSYVVSSKPLTVKHVIRDVTNCLMNSSFEEVTGDLIMDASSAWPTDWKLSPKEAPTSVLSFAKGRSGDRAIRLDTREESTGAWIQQRLKVPAAGLWCLRAQVRLEKGKTRLLHFIIVDEERDRWPKKKDALSVTGTGDWQEIEFTKQIPEANGWMRAMVGLEEAGGIIDIDDLELGTIR